MAQTLYGGIEAGGTKFICAIATAEGEILRETQFPTLGPDETLEKAIEEITQDVITVSSEDEGGFRKAVTAIYEQYRSPRTPYSFWGSSRDGERIAKAIADETSGGW